MLTRKLIRGAGRLPSSSPTAPRRPHKPSFDSLEERLTLTAGLNVDNDRAMVTIFGEASATNTISVDVAYGTNSTEIVARINGTEYRGSVNSFINRTRTIRVLGGDQKDVITVNSIPGSSAGSSEWYVEINPGQNDDDVIINGGISRPTSLRVDGGMGTNTLTINDQARQSDSHYWVRDDLVRWQVDGRPDLERIVNYSNTNLVIKTGNGNNNVRVRSLGASTSLEVQGGQRSDTFLLYSDANALDEIRGHVKLQGGGGTNSAAFFDQYGLGTVAGGAGRTYRLGTRGTDDVLSWADGTAEIVFSQIQSAELDTSVHNDTVTFAAHHLNAALTLVDQGGSDTLVAGSFVNAWVIDGAGTGTLNGMRFHTFENLTGGASSDTFTFTTGGSIAGNLDGGLGTDTLTYINYGSPTTVKRQLSLLTSTAWSATGVGGSVYGVENLPGIVYLADPQLLKLATPITPSYRFLL